MHMPSALEPLDLVPFYRLVPQPAQEDAFKVDAKDTLSNDRDTDRRQIAGPYI